MNKKLIITLLIVFVLTTGCSSDSEADKKYQELANGRFAEIQESAPEIDSIECYQDNCKSVAYFNLNRIPKDLELLIRSNTATFSRFKLDYLGVSHVSVIATLNGKTILTCDGSKGKVDSCE